MPGNQSAVFSDLKVLELASVLAGPSVGQFFAELGAEVIKVENVHARGDVTRSWKVAGEKTDDKSAYFCSVNWGKKSIAIDLVRDEGRAIVYELVKRADIIIVSYKPGDEKKLGVDYKTLSSLNDRLIYSWVTGYGSQNRQVGYDAVIQAEAGFMFMNGEPGGRSLKMPVALIDILASHHLKEGILLALLKRERSGKGELVEVSLLQAAVASLANQATNWLIAGHLPQKQGSSHPNIAPYGDIFLTSDSQELLLAVGNDRQFSQLCQVLGIPAVALDTQYYINALRVENRRNLNEILAARVSLFKSEELFESLTRANVPAGLVRNLANVFQLPEIQDIMINSAGMSGVLNYAGMTSGIAQNRNIGPHFLPPPHFGEHSREILLSIPGVSLEIIETLKNKGIVA